MITESNQMKTKPNFFIIGAPKCGTTSLAAYLLKHPEVFMPGTWEFNFLADDLLWINPSSIRCEEDYLLHFQGADNYKRIGEKSAFYLYSKTAARQIYSLNPHSKIICILRNPVDVIWSFYKYNLANFEEDIWPFELALAAENERKAGSKIPSTVSIVQNLYYREIVCFAEQLERYFKVFGRQNIHVMFFDEFTKNTEQEYQKVLEFLEISPFSLPLYKTHNESGNLHNLKLRRFLLTHPKLKQLLISVLPQLLRQNFLSKEKFFNIPVKQRRFILDPTLRLQLMRETRPEVKRLGNLLGKDLSFWYKTNTNDH